METSEHAVDDSARQRAADVDVLIVGAGITGIYQLYRACEAGFTATLLEAGGGCRSRTLRGPLRDLPRKRR